MLGFCTKLTLRCLAKASWSSTGIFGKQNKSDLRGLMHCLDTLQYQSRIFCKVAREWLSFLKNERESLANNRWVNEMPFLPTFTPFKLLEALACVKEMDRILVSLVSNLDLVWRTWICFHLLTKYTALRWHIPLSTLSILYQTSSPQGLPEEIPSVTCQVLLFIILWVRIFFWLMTLRFIKPILLTIFSFLFVSSFLLLNTYFRG